MPVSPDTIATPCVANPTSARLAPTGCASAGRRRSAARSSPPSARPPGHRASSSRGRAPFGRSAFALQVETRSSRVGSKRGHRPATTPVASAATTVNARTRASSRSSSDTAIGIGRSIGGQHAHQPPREADADGGAGAGEHEALGQQLPDEAAARRRQARAGCRPRAPAPAPRASSMPATFAHAISSTRPTANMQPLTITDEHPVGFGMQPRVALAARTRHAPALVGLRIRRRAAAPRPPDARARACRRVTPGFKPRLREQPALTRAAPASTIPSATARFR